MMGGTGRSNERVLFSGHEVVTESRAMSQEWYYARGEQKRGPIALEQLRALARSGELAPTDLVWTEGMGDWQAASSVKDLMPTARSTPPPLKATVPAKSPTPVTGIIDDAVGVAGSPPRQPWYCHWAFLTFTTLAFFPVTLVLVWWKSTFSKRAKWAWTAACGLMLLAAIGRAHPDAESTNPPSVATPSEKPKRSLFAHRASRPNPKVTPPPAPSEGGEDGSQPVEPVAEPEQPSTSGGGARTGLGLVEKGKNQASGEGVAPHASPTQDPFTDALRKLSLVVDADPDCLLAYSVEKTVPNRVLVEILGAPTKTVQQKSPSVKRLQTYEFGGSQVSVEVSPGDDDASVILHSVNYESRPNAIAAQLSESEMKAKIRSVVSSADSDNYRIPIDKLFRECGRPSSIMHMAGSDCMLYYKCKSRGLVSLLAKITHRTEAAKSIPDEVVLGRFNLEP